MTAGRSAGTEQGQRREVCNTCGHINIAHTRDSCCRTGCTCSIGYSGGNWVTPADRTRRRLVWFTDDELAGELARRSSPSVPPARHNHARFSNDGGPWSPCPGDCPVWDSGRDEAPLDSSLIAAHDATGDQSGRDEAREAVARWVFGYLLHNRPASDYDDWLSDNDRDMFRARADQILSLGPVAALLRDGTTT